jgi:hypothetical protein
MVWSASASASASCASRGFLGTCVSPGSCGTGVSPASRFLGSCDIGVSPARPFLLGTVDGGGVSSITGGLWGTEAALRFRLFFFHNARNLLDIAMQALFSHRDAVAFYSTLDISRSWAAKSRPIFFQSLGPGCSLRGLSLQTVSDTSTTKIGRVGHISHSRPLRPRSKLWCG